MPFATSARPARARISTQVFWALIAVSFVVAAAVRIFAWNKWFRDLPLALDDNYFYHWQAKLLADGHGFANPFFLRNSGISVPSAAHPPLFSTLLSIPSLLGAGSVEAHRVFACLLGATVVVPVGLAARRLAGPLAGLAGAASAAIFPALWMNDGLLLSETAAAVAVAWVIVFALRVAMPAGHSGFEDTSFGGFSGEAPASDSEPADQPATQRSLLVGVVALGVACGIAALSRSELVLLGPLLILPLAVVRGAGWREKAKLTVAGGIVMAAVIAPWVVRNLVTFEKPTTLSTGAGFVADIANCDATYSGKMLGYWSPECEKPDRPTSSDESVIEADLRADGLAYVSSHKAELPKVALARIGRVFHLFRIEQSASFDTFFERRPKIGVDAGIAMFYLVAAVSIVGLGRVLRRRDAGVAVVLLSPLAITAISAASGIGITRYRVAADVAMIVTAGLAVPVLLALAIKLRGAIAHRFESLGSPRPLKSSAAIVMTAAVALAIRWYVILGSWPTCPQDGEGLPIRSQSCFAIWGDALYSHLQGVRNGHGEFYINPFLWSHERPFVTPSAGDPPFYSGMLGVVTWFGSVLSNWVSIPLSLLLIAAIFVLVRRLGAVRRYETAVAQVAVAGTAALWVSLPLLVIAIGGGEGGAIHRLVSAWFGATAVMFIGVAARRIAGPWAAVIAAVVAAVHPLLWVNDVMLMSETPYVCFLSIALWAAYRYWRTPTMGWACTVSLFVGLAAVTRAESSLLFGFMVLPLFARARGLSAATKVKQLAAGAAIAVALIGPWLTYNTVRFREGNLTTMTTGTGSVLGSASCDQTYYGEMMGYWAECIREPFTSKGDGTTDVSALVSAMLMTDQYSGRVIALCGAKVDGAFVTDPKVVPAAGQQIEVLIPRRPNPDAACKPTAPWSQVLDESESDGIIRAMARTYMDAHTSRLPKVAAARVLRMFSAFRVSQTWHLEYELEGRGKWTSAAGLLLWWGMAIPAAGALVWMWRRSIPVAPLVAPFLTIAATAALTFGINRYRVPCDLAEVILFGVAAGAFIEWMRRRSAARTAGASR